MIARPSIVADSFGVSRFAGILAVMTVPIALSRAGAPLAAARLGDWRFLVALGSASMLAAAALIPLSRKPPVDRAPAPSQDCPMPEHSCATPP
ncbi:hypothetical protein [Nocardia sp. R6R-6]|uniref:hypothetical protein n=1 Tax=Nocardia sp. R6R-6 TaxID=3459303 RepID=UPI00403DE771